MVLFVVVLGAGGAGLGGRVADGVGVRGEGYRRAVCSGFEVAVSRRVAVCFAVSVDAVEADLRVGAASLVVVVVGRPVVVARRDGSGGSAVAVAAVAVLDGSGMGAR